MAILINDTAPRAQYTATSGQTVFTVPFEFFVNSDLKVYRNSTLLTLTTNYTVTGAGVTGGGSVTFVTGATAGDIVTIVRDVPVARTSDFPTSGPFNIEALNTDLDRLTAMVQQQETLDGRSLRLDQFDTPNTLNVLPVKSSRVGRVLQFNSSTGQPEAGPTTSEIANAQTYATNASTSATAAAASAATASSAAASTAGSVAAAAASASAASTSASNASTSASNALTSATNAASSASTATTQATNSAASAALANDWATKTSGAVAGGEFSAKYHAQAAATSASNASTSASNAASSASSASAAQTAAESARDATLAAYDSFDDRYLGAKASDPSVDNDGNALVAGALYFNSTDGVMKLYTGSSWVAAYVSGAGFLALSGGTMTGTVNFVSGSAAAPGIAASGDTNTGIFFPAADTIAFAEGGVEALRINSDAQVVTAAGTVSLPAITTTGDLNTGIFFPAADTIAFGEGGAEAMRIDSSGNVGIGTSSPAVKLQVTTSGSAALPPSSGTTPSTGELIRLRTSSDAAGGIGTIGLATNQMWLQACDATNLGAYYTLLLNPNGGNVGIGTGASALTKTLTVQASEPMIQLVDSDSSTRVANIGGQNGNVTIDIDPAAAAASSQFAVNIDNTERFRIASSGQIGIGGANYGTSGQVLTSQGSGSAPVWAAAGGGQIQAQMFTSSGSWIAPSGVTQVLALVVGGAGGGHATSEKDGGFGGAAYGLYTVVPGTSYTITVGTGGAGVNTGTAGSGTTSSFSSFCSATGGTGATGTANGTTGSGTGGTLRNTRAASGLGKITGETYILRNNLAALAWSINSAYIPGASGGGTAGSTSGGGGGVVYLEWVGS